MSPSAVPLVARQGKRSVMGMMALVTEPSDRCSRQYAPTVAKIPSYPLNPAVTNRCTVAIATVKSESADSAGLTLRAYMGGVFPVCVCF